MAVTVVVFSVANAQAHGHIEYETHIEREEINPLVEVHIDGPIKKKFGWAVSALLSRHEGEALGGFSYSPKKSAKFYASGGVETHEHHQSAVGRFALTLNGKRWSFFHYSQVGGSGYKTKNIAKRNFDSFAVGAYGKTYFGVGPYAEKKWGEKVSIWGTVGFGYHRPKGILGVKYNFDF